MDALFKIAGGTVSKESVEAVRLIAREIHEAITRGQNGVAISLSETLRALVPMVNNTSVTGCNFTGKSDGV
jgi:ubiquinone biosynthesis protein UbiJ